MTTAERELHESVLQYEYKLMLNWLLTDREPTYTDFMTGLNYPEIEEAIVADSIFTYDDALAKARSCEAAAAYRKSKYGSTSTIAAVNTSLYHKPKSSLTPYYCKYHQRESAHTSEECSLAPSSSQQQRQQFQPRRRYDNFRPRPTNSHQTSAEAG